MPYDTFEWKGIDGTTILTHFITTPAGKETTMYSYNGMIDAASLRGIWDNYSNKGLNSDLLLCYGYGDGGRWADTGYAGKSACFISNSGYARC